ncbi:MAG TPA: DUF4214 domain-containing protein [Pyrinomonadaceae bacterium]|jgi:hypothetical protein|nr:DUF4214 domain-containing protein [Pyrinomonadaceae bacterium]
MSETREPEIDIEELKAGIRRQVERRETEPTTPYAQILAEFDNLEPASLTQLLIADPFSDEFTQTLTKVILQNEFVRRSDDRYHLNDLLKYDDQKFVWIAYLALLKREPDEEGFTAFLERLRRGRLTKIDILARLRYSPEGKRMKVTVDGLRVPALIRRLCLSVPVRLRTRALNLRSKISGE